MSRGGPPSSHRTPRTPRAPEDSERGIRVRDVDLHEQENLNDHNTEDYFRGRRSPGLIVRRGQEFKITLTFDTVYSPREHDLALRFYTGDLSSAKQENGTLQYMRLDDKTSHWYARITDVRGASVELRIMTPPHCVIGKWYFGLLKRESEYPIKLGEVKILFNPWCKADIVYMNDTHYDPPNVRVDPKSEYILNSIGCVFKGSGMPFAQRWRFGQFDEGILDICLQLIYKSSGGYVDERFGDPMYVSRLIAKMVNSQDDNGVLVGNWSGNYSGGKRPNEWSGSVRLLKQYGESGGTPVKFGQCWVYSGVTTTVCRALGLPCRSVTNYSSAHDTHDNAIIERFYGENGEKIQVWDQRNQRSIGSDSIWNFHVWNEVWMRRPDINSDCDGWQVIDATPQEQSKGMYTCGPAPVSAIKKGHVHLGQDTKFVFGEVNGDVVTYEVKDGKLVKTKTDKTKVGKMTCTRVPNGTADNRPLYITSNYKYREGSYEEREAVANATGINRRNQPDDRPNINVTMTIAYGELYIGEDFDVVIELKNETTEGRRLNINALKAIVLSTSYDDGDNEKVVARHEEVGFPLRHDQRKIIKMHVRQQDYLRYLSDDTTFKVYAKAKVMMDAGSGIDLTEEDSFRLKVPDIDVRVREPRCEKDKTIPVYLAVKNPLNKRLTGCKLVIETDHFEDVNPIDEPDISPYGKWQKVVSLTGMKRGKGNAIVRLETNEIADMDGSIDIYVY